jgi:uncharacterized protein YhaN
VGRGEKRVTAMQLEEHYRSSKERLAEKCGQLKKRVEKAKGLQSITEAEVAHLFDLMTDFMTAADCRHQQVLLGMVARVDGLGKRVDGLGKRVETLTTAPPSVIGPTQRSPLILPGT